MVFKKIPDRWENFSSIGTVVEGTAFLPFKVPLKSELSTSLPDDVALFRPSDLLEHLLQNNLRVGIIIDLTNTTRYYLPQEFEDNGIYYVKIFTEGHAVPSQRVCQQFFETVDSFLSSATDDNLIGVHCTHGVNRTGYLICRYMVDKLQMKPQDCIDAFKMARGHALERENYINALLDENYKSNEVYSDVVTLDNRNSPNKHKKHKSYHHAAGYVPYDRKYTSGRNNFYGELSNGGNGERVGNFNDGKDYNRSNYGSCLNFEYNGAHVGSNFHGCNGSYIGSNFGDDYCCGSLRNRNFNNECYSYNNGYNYDNRSFDESFKNSNPNNEYNSYNGGYNYDNRSFNGSFKNRNPNNEYNSYNGSFKNRNSNNEYNSYNGGLNYDNRSSNDNYKYDNEKGRISNNKFKWTKCIGGIGSNDSGKNGVVKVLFNRQKINKDSTIIDKINIINDVEVSFTDKTTFDEAEVSYTDKTTLYEAEVSYADKNSEDGSNEVKKITESSNKIEISHLNKHSDSFKINR